MNELAQFLKSLELDEPKIKTIEEKMTSLVNDAKSDVEKEMKEQFKDYEDIKKNNESLSKDLDKFKADLTEKTEAYKTLEQTLEKEKLEASNKLTKTIIEKEVEKKLLKIPNGELLKSQLDLSKAKLNKAGKLEGMDDQIENAINTYPDVFSPKKLSGETPQQLTQNPSPKVTAEEVATWSQDKIMGNWDAVKNLFFK